MEVVATIQAFLDARADALPTLARQRREARGQGVESQDEYSFGIDFSAVDLAALGGDVVEQDPIQQQEEEFARVGYGVTGRGYLLLIADHQHCHLPADLSVVVRHVTAPD